MGSQFTQHFPYMLSPLEEKLLFYLYRTRRFKAKQIKGLCKIGGPLDGYNRNSIYNALKVLENKGFVINKGHGKVEYMLTKIGEAQAKWLDLKI